MKGGGSKGKKTKKKSEGHPPLVIAVCMASAASITDAADARNFPWTNSHALTLFRPTRKKQPKAQHEDKGNQNHKRSKQERRETGEAHMHVSRPTAFT